MLGLVGGTYCRGARTTGRSPFGRKDPGLSSASMSDTLATCLSLVILYQPNYARARSDAAIAA